MYIQGTIYAPSTEGLRGSTRALSTARPNSCSGWRRKNCGARAVGEVEDGWGAEARRQGGSMAAWHLDTFSILFPSLTSPGPGGRPSQGKSPGWPAPAAPLAPPAPSG